MTFTQPNTVNAKASREFVVGSRYVVLNISVRVSGSEWRFARRQQLHLRAQKHSHKNQPQNQRNFSSKVAENGLFLLSAAPEKHTSVIG